VSERLPLHRHPTVAAALGGVAYCLGYVGWGAWPLLFVFVVPLWRALEDTRRVGLGASALAGFVFGATAYAGGYPWLWRLVGPFLGGNVAVGAGLWLAHGVWFAAGFAVYAIVFHLLRARGWPLAWAGVPPWLALEWLQPQLFPVYAGAGLVRAGLLVQIADLGGPLLLSALVLAGNVVFHATWLWLRGARPRPLAAWGTAIALGAVVVSYGAIRTAGLESADRDAPALRVGVVQANLGLLEKRSQGVVGHRRHLEQTRALLAEGPLDLVVWPETAYVRGLRRPLPLAGAAIRGDLAVPLLFGGTSVWEEDGRRVSANSALLVGRDGMIREAYDKNWLIPLAEFAPFSELVPGASSLFPHVQAFRAASDTPALHLGPWRIATPICYEAVRPAFVRRMVAEARPQLFVTLANDAWFGASQEPWIHLALARLRAVEHRLWMVRSTNSGVSAVIDPAGRIVAQTGLLTRANLRATVHPRNERTLYGRLGDWPGALGLLATVAGFLARPPRTSA